jgi:hypothetical protein
METQKLLNITQNTIQGLNVSRNLIHMSHQIHIHMIKKIKLSNVIGEKFYIKWQKIITNIIF